MKLPTTYFLAAAMLLAQTTTPVGSVKFLAPTPGVITATAGTVTCTFTANASPATAVAVSCTLGTDPISYPLPMVGNTTYYVEHASCIGCAAGVKGDDVSALFSPQTTGGIQWQVSATPNGGTAFLLAGKF
ncbi:MAG TPA: hypothetical protein VGL72_13995 [Bryobacteraceae bacterium]